MLNNKVSSIGLTLIVLGILLLMKLLGIITVKTNEIYGNMMLFLGITSVFFNVGKNRRGELFLGASVFMLGVLFHVLNNYDILNTNRLFLPSLLFITATGFIILFLDNQREKSFLLVSIVLYLLSFITVKYYSDYGIISFTNSIGFLVLEFWPVLIILIGVGLMVERKI